MKDEEARKKKDEEERGKKDEGAKPSDKTRTSKRSAS